jgi:predicted DCC family thiol-disulfide oxidoreductase YuxK
MMEEKRKIVFYDGDCGFCNRSVAVVMKYDKAGLIHFAPIQSGFTQKMFAEMKLPQPDLSTFYFYEDGKMYEKSKAAFRVAKYFGFPRNLVRVFLIVPRPIRDWVYDQVAKRRQRLSKGFCVMPTPEQRQRFIA